MVLSLRLLSVVPAAVGGDGGLQFNPPQRVGEGWWADYFVGLDDAAGSRLATGLLWEGRKQRPALYVYDQAEAVWHPHAPTVGFAAATLPSHCPSPCERLAVLRPPKRWTFNGTRTEFTINSTIVDSSSGVPHNLTCVRPGVGCIEGPELTFQGLPPVVSGAGARGGIRFGGTASLLHRGAWLQTAIVTLAGGPGPRPTKSYPPVSVVLLRSMDARTFIYVATIAHAADFPESLEGPNENDVIELPDGSLLAVVRLDGEAADPAQDKPYYAARSHTSGASWTSATPLPGTGCVRPRLLLLETTLLLAGGRRNYAREPGDILLWESHTLGNTWKRYSISAAHNAGVRNATLSYTHAVNDTSRGPAAETTAYTSLIRIAEHKALLVYDAYLREPVGAVTFSMEVATLN